MIGFVFHSKLTADYCGDTVRQSPATRLGDAGARRASFERCPGWYTDEGVVSLMFIKTILRPRFHFNWFHQIAYQGRIC